MHKAGAEGGTYYTTDKSVQKHMVHSHTSTSSLGGGGGVGSGELRFFWATAEGSIGTDTVVSGGNGGSTATPSPKGRVPDSPPACGSGASPGASGLSSVKDMSNDN
jgi:hypothetical protein